MTSPRLEAMAKRAARPVHVRFIPQEPAEFGEFRIVAKVQNRFRISYQRQPEQATRAYFDLVSTLETEPLDPAVPSPGGEPADGRSATVAPRGGL